jgi:endonuclease-3 related protein
MRKIISRLEKRFGRKEWWPSGRFPDKRWEICVGAVLTQNTNWRNVEKALQHMKEKKILSYKDIMEISMKELENAVRPSGFYKQKAKRLKALAMMMHEMGGMDAFAKDVSREQLLSVNGIGNETADSMLLYALGRKEFVVDAYTKRVFSRVGILNGNESYMEIKVMFEKEIPPEDYAQMHAWIVKLAKAYCQKVPSCGGCPLQDVCDFGRSHRATLFADFARRR